MNHPAAFTFLVFSLIFPFTIPIQQNGPPDKPIAANSEQADKLDKAIEPHVKKAKETLPEAKKRYLAGLPKDQTFFVTIKLYDTSRKYEIVFVKVNSWKGNVVQGNLASDLTLIRGHSKNEKLSCDESEILDWTISKPDGTEEGNFVGKFLDTYQP